MRKKYRIAIALVCVMSLIMVACGQGTTTITEPQQTTNDGGETDETTTVSEELTFPIVDERLTLTLWTPLGFKQQTVMSSWDEIAFFDIMTEMTNIELEFLHPAVGGEVEQRNSMIAARNLPDIMYTNWDSIPGGPSKMILDDIIIDIDPLLQENAPNLLRYWDEKPDLRRYTYTDEGNCFGMPYYWPEDEGYLFHFGFVIRGDWAEKLDVKHPTNVDEWYEYLVAVRDGDPNNSDSADELPLVAQGFGGLLQTQRMYGIEPNSIFYQENNQLVTAIKQPEYREWLITMNKWYEENLIDPDVLSTDRPMLDNKVLTDLAGAYWSGAGTGQLGLYMRQKQNAGDEVFSLNPVPMPTTAKGERLGWLKIMPSEAAGITSANNYPRETIRYMDYFFTEEGHLLSQLGPEGIVYSMVNGEIEFTEYATNNPDGLSFDSAVILYGLTPWSFVGYQLRDYWKYNISFTPQAASSDEIWGDYTHNKSLLSAAIRFTESETSTVASITNDLQALIEETVSNIILGQWDISRFDEMVSQAEQIGLDELREIYEVAYERSMNR